MPVARASLRQSMLVVRATTLFICVVVAALTVFAIPTSASADVDMTGGLEKASTPLSKLEGGVNSLATSANGTYRCTYEYSVVANWYYYFAIGNCRPGWELEVVSYAPENSGTHEHSYGGFVNNAFSGCGWIDTRYPLEKLNNNSHSACAGGGSGREFKVEETTFMEKYNHGTAGDGNPVVNPKSCPEYANYRPWSSSNVEKELIRTAPAYAASEAGSNYPALKWRYVTKYASTDGSGKYVMVRDDRIGGAGEGNWAFVPLSCLRSSASELPENAEERNPPSPTATTGGSSNITTTSATLAGSIDPNGVDTHYYIEWGKEASKPYENFAPQPYPGEDVGSGTGTVNRNVTATGLSPNTIYYYRLVAMSATGTGEGSTGSFKTAANPPNVTTQAATNVTETQATLNGSVNPNGADTHYYFQYGMTTNYGSTTPEADAGAGESSVGASANINSLQPDTTYHYRIVGSHSAETPLYGEDRTFTTRVAPSLVNVSGTIAAASQDVNNGLYLTTRNSLSGLWQSALLGESSGAIFSAPSAVATSGGEVWVAFEGPSNSLWDGFESASHEWHTSTQGTANTTFSAPSEVIDSSGNVWAVAEGANHSLFMAERPHTTGIWETWKAISAEDVYSAPSAVATSGGEVWVAFEGPSNSLWDGFESASHEWHTSTQGTANTTFSAPSEVIDSSGNVVATAQGTSHHLFAAERPHTTGIWETWTAIGAEDVYSAPSTVATAGGEIWVAFQGPSNSLWDGYESASHEWHISTQGTNGTAYSAPSELVDSAGDVWAGAEGASNSLYIVVRQVSNGEWNTAYNGG